MPYHATVRSERFVFADLRDLLAKANEAKSGDALPGIAARSERERVAAQLALSDVRLGEIVDHPLLDPETDDITRLLLDTFDAERFHPLRSLTVGEFREYLLDDATDEMTLRPLAWALTPEVIAATAKLMSNKD